MAHLFEDMINKFPNLQCLNLNPFSYNNSLISFSSSPLNVYSLDLLELHLTFNHFNDCVHLLDGHFSQLRILDVEISVINSSSVMNNKVCYLI
jgi:hypothetical protein